MTADLLSIGELARLSRLSVTALRYYADTGVLVPHQVDESTGYRYFHPDQVRDAELLHELRQLGLPVRVLRALVHASADDVESVLEQRLAHLREAVADGEAVIARVQSLLRSEHLMASGSAHLTDLAAVVDRVLPAAGTDPERPVLQCFLVELEGTTLRLVATDSFRLSIGEAVCSVGDGSGAWAVNAIAFADAVRGATAPTVELIAYRDRLEVVAGDTTTSLDVVEGYPAYRGLVAQLGPSEVSVELDLDETIQWLRTQSDAKWVALDTDGSHCVLRSETGSRSAPAPASGRAEVVTVAAAFLADALNASVGPDAIIEIRGAESPLVVRSATDGAFTTLVMPIRMHAPTNA